MTKNFLVILLLALSFKLSFAQAPQNIAGGDYKTWQALHHTYTLALDEIYPDMNFSEVKVSKEDFIHLQENSEIRAAYLDLIAEAEQFCELNTQIPACSNLMQVIEEKSIVDCLGNVDLMPKTDGIRLLKDNLEPLWLAASQNEFKNYSDSKAVKDMIVKMRSNLNLRCTKTVQSSCKSKRRQGSLGQCLRYMKLGLIAGGYMRTNPGVASAKNFGPQLKKLGFRNLKDEQRHKNMTSRQVPHGAILVYSSSDPKRPHGHIEIYDADNKQYLSDFPSSNPIDTYNGKRHLIGVYVK